MVGIPSLPGLLGLPPSPGDILKLFIVLELTPFLPDLTQLKKKKFFKNMVRSNFFIMDKHTYIILSYMDSSLEVPQTPKSPPQQAKVEDTCGRAGWKADTVSSVISSLPDYSPQTNPTIVIQAPPLSINTHDQSLSL